MLVKVQLVAVATYRISPLDYVDGKGIALTDQQVLDAVKRGVEQRPGNFLWQDQTAVHVEVYRG